MLLYVTFNYINLLLTLRWKRETDYDKKEEKDEEREMKRCSEMKMIISSEFESDSKTSLILSTYFRSFPSLSLLSRHQILVKTCYFNSLIHLLRIPILLFSLSVSIPIS